MIMGFKKTFLNTRSIKFHELRQTFLFSLDTEFHFNFKEIDYVIFSDAYSFQVDKHEQDEDECF